MPRELLARDRGELFIYLATVGSIVTTNLLKGLLFGGALSVVKLAWSSWLNV